MIDQQIEIPTKDGHTTTFISHPERGGPFPVIIFYMDAPAIREELRDMARRLATSGYYVMLPNLYYRSGVMELGPIPPDPEAPERKRMFGYMNSINIPLVMEDTTRPARLRRHPAGRAHRHCRHRRLLHERALCDQRGDAFSRSASRPRHRSTERIWPPTSPTVRIWPGSKTKAELYFGCAETDIYAPTEIIEKVKQSMKDDGANAEVEIYPGTHHGFAFPKRPVYHRDAAERHWERLLALYRRNLSS